MKVDKYHEYLRSPKWREISEAVKRRAGHRCQVCNSGDNLQAHHRSYRKVFHEEDAMDDLICLCDNCHSLYHGKGEAPRPAIIGMGMAKANPSVPIVVLDKASADVIVCRKPVYHWMQSVGVDPTKRGWRKKIVGRSVPAAWLH